jgi:repressor LexA
MNRTPARQGGDVHEPLTPRQRDILAVITRAVETTGQAPGLTDIGAALGGISSPSVYKHILALEAKGYIRRHPNQRPPIELLLPLPATSESRVPASVRVAGTLQAGEPLALTEGGDDYIVVERGLLNGSSDVVALRVQGYGLSGEGLLDGDLLIVHAQSNAKPGATVVAVLDGGGATVRRYLATDGTCTLTSLQPGGEPLRVTHVELYGTVVAAIRRYA